MINRTTTLMFKNIHYNISLIKFDSIVSIGRCLREKNDLYSIVMKIYCLSTFKTSSEGHTTLLTTEKNLTHVNYFTRSFAANFIDETSILLINKARQNMTEPILQPIYCSDVVEDIYIFHMMLKEDKTIVVITDREYPSITAQKLCLAAMNGRSLEELIEMPVDKIDIISRDMQSIVVVLQDNMQKIMLRGEKLDSLIEKTETLSAASKNFYRTAKKMNSCCVVA